MLKEIMRTIYGAYNYWPYGDRLVPTFVVRQDRPMLQVVDSRPSKLPYLCTFGYYEFGTALGEARALPAPSWTPLIPQLNLILPLYEVVYDHKVPPFCRYRLIFSSPQMACFFDLYETQAKLLGAEQASTSLLPQTHPQPL